MRAQRLGFLEFSRFSNSQSSDLALLRTQRLSFLKFFAVVLRFCGAQRLGFLAFSQFSNAQSSALALFRAQRLSFLGFLEFMWLRDCCFECRGSVFSSCLGCVEFTRFSQVSVAPGARAPNAPSAPRARHSYANLNLDVCGSFRLGQFGGTGHASARMRVGLLLSCCLKFCFFVF